LRWYFFTSKYPWDGYRFSLETIGEEVKFLLQLWNTYAFYVLYANANSIDRAVSGEPTEFDRWADSRLQATVATVRERLDDFDATTAGRAIQDYLEELSNWYVRRSRRRFWDGDPAAFVTLRTALVTLAKLLAPFIPFLADEIYDNLDGSLQSVHLTDFPEPGERDERLEQTMAVVRQAVRLGLAARAQATVKVRQPLRAAVIVATGAEREAIERFPDLIREELNVRELRFVAQADELGELEVKPNYRTLGPRFGKQMPLVAAAVAALDTAGVAQSLRDGKTVAINISGQEHALSAEDLLVSMKPLQGYQVEREGSHAVALELEIDVELQVEGWAREIVRAIQTARRDAGLEVSDRIALTLDGDEDLIGAARSYADYISEETLAVQVSYERLDGVAPVVIDGRELRVAVALA
jgi:isoleucyl-tRNA synthetase